MKRDDEDVSQDKEDLASLPTAPHETGGNAGTHGHRSSCCAESRASTAKPCMWFHPGLNLSNMQSEEWYHFGLTPRRENGATLPTQAREARAEKIDAKSATVLAKGDTGTNEHSNGHEWFHEGLQNGYEQDADIPTTQGSEKGVKDEDRDLYIPE